MKNYFCILKCNFLILKVLQWFQPLAMFSFQSLIIIFVADIKEIWPLGWLSSNGGVPWTSSFSWSINFLVFIEITISKVITIAGYSKWKVRRHSLGFQDLVSQLPTVSCVWFISLCLSDIFQSICWLSQNHICIFGKTYSKIQNLLPDITCLMASLSQECPRHWFPVIRRLCCFSNSPETALSHQILVSFQEIQTKFHY